MNPPVCCGMAMEHHAFIDAAECGSCGRLVWAEEYRGPKAHLLRTLQTRCLTLSELDDDHEDD